jgi:hypothetical protein
MPTYRKPFEPFLQKERENNRSQIKLFLMESVLFFIAFILKWRNIIRLQSGRYLWKLFRLQWDILNLKMKKII